MKHFRHLNKFSFLRRRKWAMRVISWQKFLRQTLHLKGFTFSFISKCLRRLDLAVKLMLQIPQMCVCSELLSMKWTFSWEITWCFWANIFLHVLYPYGFSPVSIVICEVRWCLWVNVALQIVHCKGLDTSWILWTSRFSSCWYWNVFVHFLNCTDEYLHGILHWIQRLLSVLKLFGHS